jgi:ubiquinone/menaquinone biosynthesis C-methylase UbiE
MSYIEGAEVYARVMAPILATARQPLLKSVASHEIHKALDIGTGPGLLLRELKELWPLATVVGVDLSPTMLELAPKDALLACMDAAQLGFREEAFDAVFMTFVLTSMPDPVSSLRQVEEMLTRGGVLRTASWNARGESKALRQWIAALDDAGASPASNPGSHVREPDQIVGILEEAGFEHINCWTHDFSFKLSADDFLDLRTSLGMSAERFKSLSPSICANLLSDFKAVLSEMSAKELTEGGRAILTTSVRL